MSENMRVWSDNLPGSWYYEAVQEATNSHKCTRLQKQVPALECRFECWLEVLPEPIPLLQSSKKASVA